MKITKRQLRRIILEYGSRPDDINLAVAMRIKDMMPPDEALRLHDDDIYDLVVSVYEKEFDDTGEGWDPYDEDIEEIRDHLTLTDEMNEACGLGTAEELSPTLPAALPPAVVADSVPVPEDYSKVRDFLEVTPPQNLTISAVKQAAGTGCERSTAQGIIDHLKDRMSADTIIERFSPQAKSAGEDGLRRAILTFVDEYSMGMELDPSDPATNDRIKAEISRAVEQVLG